MPAVGAGISETRFIQCRWVTLRASLHSNLPTHKSGRTLGEGVRCHLPAPAVSWGEPRLSTEHSEPQVQEGQGAGVGGGKRGRGQGAPSVLLRVSSRTLYS